MTCCIGDKHNNWCEDYDIVYVDAEGKEYCIFHAPAEHKYSKRYVEGEGERPKLMSGDDFNELVFARIQAVIDAGEDEEFDSLDIFRIPWNPRCNLAGTVFFANISFSEFNSKNRNYLPSINFSYSQFLGRVSFSKSQFQGGVHFRECLFHGHVDFKSCQLQEFVNFSSSKFEDYVDFSYSQFKGDVYFSCTLFQKETDFSYSQFFARVDFHNLFVYSRIFFKNSKFRANVDFNNSIIYKIDFVGAEFGNNITFDGCEFTLFQFDKIQCKSSALFSSCKFLMDTSFNNSVFESFVNFDKCIFEYVTTFNNSLFKEYTYFNRSIFKKEISLRGSISNSTILFEKIDLANLSLVGVNIDSIRFTNCNWGKSKYATLFDSTKTDVSYSEIEEMYRALKKNARDNADEMQSSHWHYKEKEVQRKQINRTLRNSILGIVFLCIFLPISILILSVIKTPPYFVLLIFVFTLFLLIKLIQIASKTRKESREDVLQIDWFAAFYINIYYIVSGYGESPFRAFIFLLFLILGPFLLGQNITTSDPCVSFNYENYIPLLHPLKDSKPWEAAWQLLITLQAALFAFALRNKLRR